MRLTLDSDKLEIVKFALQHTEDRLEASMKNAEAIENKIHRFAAFTIGFMVFVASNANSFPDPTIVWFYVVMCVAVSLFCMSAMMPRKFHVKGHFWHSWKGHLEDEDALIDVLISQAQENDVRIEENERSNDAIAKIYRRGFRLVVASTLFLFGWQIGVIFPFIQVEP
jgi:hypothetical protein